MNIQSKYNIKSFKFLKSNKDYANTTTPISVIWFLYNIKSKSNSNYFNKISVDKYNYFILTI